MGLGLLIEVEDYPELPWPTVIKKILKKWKKKTEGDNKGVGQGRKIRRKRNKTPVHSYYEKH